MDPIKAVELQIARVNEEIEALSTEIKEAKERIKHAEAAGNIGEVQRWDKKEEKLQEKENELRKEKNKLLDKEARLQSAAAAGPSTSGTMWRHPMLTADDSMDQLYKRTSRVYHNDEIVGTIARIQVDGLCASATHVFVHDGKFLSCTAFGGDAPLKLVASLPFHDIIFVKGPPGPAFGFQTSELYEPGREVAFVGHPSAPARELQLEKVRDANPAVAHGRVVMLMPTLELAAADYHAAMPNSSGAPVIFNSTTLAGIHLGTTYHLDDTHYKETPEEKAERTRVDRDPNAMFQCSKKNAQGKRKAVDPAALDDLQRLALHGVSNIPYKDQLALFVPASYVSNLATDHAGLVPTSSLRDRPSSRLGGRLQT